MNYCTCKRPEVENDDGFQYCLKCLKEIKPYEPDLDAEYEAQAEYEAEQKLTGGEK